MNLFVKTFFILPFLGVFAFCIFGFLATFEPLDPITQITWRAIYGITGLGSIAAILALLKPEKKIWKRSKWQMP